MSPRFTVVIRKTDGGLIARSFAGDIANRADPTSSVFQRQRLPWRRIGDLSWNSFCDGVSWSSGVFEADDLSAGQRHPIVGPWAFDHGSWIAGHPKALFPIEAVVVRFDIDAALLAAKPLGAVVADFAVSGLTEIAHGIAWRDGDNDWREEIIPEEIVCQRDVVVGRLGGDNETAKIQHDAHESFPVHGVKARFSQFLYMAIIFSAKSIFSSSGDGNLGG